MQPYFFPYLGYIHLIEAADVFVVLDDVSYPKSSWVNRNRLLINKKPGWFTFPVRKEGDLILEKEYVVDKNQFDRSLKTLRQNYPHAVMLENVISIFQHWQQSLDTRVVSSNVFFLRQTLDLLGLHQPRIVLSSELPPTDNLGRETRLITIVKSLGGDTYINLSGGRSLYHPAGFKRAGLSLQFVISKFPPYPQRAPEFVPQLSVLDYLLSHPGPPAEHSVLDAFSLEES